MKLRLCGSGLTICLAGMGCSSDPSGPSPRRHVGPATSGVSFARSMPVEQLVDGRYVVTFNRSGDVPTGLADRVAAHCHAHA